MISQLSAKYKPISEHVVFFSMLLIAVSLFFSRFLISVGFILIVLNWLLEGKLKEKINFIKHNTSGFLIVLLFVFHLIGLIYTEDLRAGFSDIRIKSFLFIIVAYGSGKRLSKKRRKDVFNIYILSALLSSIVSSLNFYVLSESVGIEDLAGMPLVGGNLYQAFMIVFAICLLLYYLFFSKSKKRKLLLFIVIIWFIFYLFLLNSLTGYMLLFALSIYSFIYFFIRIKSSKPKIIMGALFLFFFISSIVYLGLAVISFYDKDEINFSALSETTINGNNYLHDTISSQTENGHFVNVYLCEKELRKEWNVRSGFDFDGMDKKEQRIRQTLIRYLSSKDIKKDSVGIWSLQEKDINAVENGYANYIYANKFSLKARIYIVVWQLDQYFSYGFANRQTISQRIVYMKVAKKMIEKYFWFGLGPGDVLDKSKEYTLKLNAGIAPKYTSRVHNQFILEFVGLGVFGFVGFMLIFFYPFFIKKMWKNYLFTSFYLIVFLSFFVDNLFEAQIGITFFAFFYSLLFFEPKCLVKLEDGSQ